MATSNSEIKMSDVQHDKLSDSKSDIHFILNTCGTSAPESGLVTPATTPVLPSTSASKHKAAAVFLDLSTQSQADQMEGIVSSDSNPRQDPRSVRRPWYDPANYPLCQPSRHHAARNSHEPTDEEGNPLSLRWWSQHARLREDRDLNLRLWNGEMRGNRRVYRLHQWARMVDEKGRKIPTPIGRWGQYGRIVPGNNPPNQRGYNERELIYGPDPRNPCPVSRPKAEETGDETEDEDEDESDGKASKEKKKDGLAGIFDRLARRSIWDSYYLDQDWTGYGSLD
ncbi:hypothetical protein OEA41_003362 [Lepraria neglecta]|uniref:Uncharacterized protein n=1 Tax=Lepraria neglecta TaxID=209136 RepID=A0AAD9Z897_9LECA|nr:hypothetical protein OEA41_003362 [Lepraria neglecta]